MSICPRKNGCGRARARLSREAPIDTQPEDATLLQIGLFGEPIGELLISPFQRPGVPPGTVRGVNDGANRPFDQEGARILDAVARFASAAAEVVGYLQAAEEANGRLLREAETYRRGQREMFATLAHELRSPLGALANAFAVIKSRPAGEAAAQANGIVERQLLHMAKLVDALLPVARGEREEGAAADRVALQHVVQAAVEISRAEIAARGHSIHFDLPEEELFVRGDATQLVEVVANLLGNAAKYTPPGGRIALTLGHDARDAVLEVRDNGIGIAPDMLARIFHVFVQADGRNAAGGMGVGLAVAERMIARHHGSVVASSEGLGKGSTFTVRLPL